MERFAEAEQRTEESPKEEMKSEQAKAKKPQSEKHFEDSKSTKQESKSEQAPSQGLFVGLPQRARTNEVTA